MIWEALLGALAEIESPQLVFYGSYEITFLNRMMQRYPDVVGDAIGLNRLIHQSVNLLRVTYSHVFFPTFSNSLKEIAQYLGYRWSDSAASGLSSLIWRPKWELSRNPELKERLVRYNVEDCEALETVYNAVSQLHQRSNKEIPLDSDKGIVNAESLQGQNTFPFGKTEYLLPELNHINRAAYWDYQRNKVYVRSSPRLKQVARYIEKRSAKQLRPTKVAECNSLRPSNCPKCNGQKVYKYGNLVRPYTTSGSAPLASKDGLSNISFPGFSAVTADELLFHRTHIG